MHVQGKSSESKRTDPLLPIEITPESQVCLLLLVKYRKDSCSASLKGRGCG